MRSSTVQNLLVAAVMTTVIALLEGAGWPHWLVGAVFSLSLAVGVWIASAPAIKDWTLRPRTYALCAVVALAVGGVAWWMSGGDNGAFWGVGVIAGISMSISTTALRQEA